MIPARARAQFNIRYNNLHTSSSLKKKINVIVKKFSKKNKCKYKIDFIPNGDAFLTKPGRLYLWQKKLLGKLQKLIRNFLQLEALQMQDL